MAHAAKVLALLSRSVATVSTKLSIAAVLGLAAVPLLPLDAASRLGAPAPATAAAPIELIHAKPVPLAEGAPADPAFQLAARRRAQRERPEASEPAHKNSAISPAPQPAEAIKEPAPEAKPEEALAAAAKTRAKQALTPETSPPAQPDTAKHAKKDPTPAPPELQKEPSKTPVAPSDAKPEAAQAEPPKPEVWSDAEIIAGLRECVKLLAPIASEVEIAQPMRHEQCGTPAPVLLRRIGSGANKVEINPPAELNCAMVVSLHAWVEKTLQPAAREALGAPIARLRNASGYSCRARNGHPLNTDKLSEHALANAIDIAGFITSDGRTIDVARSWGATERDRREAERIAATRAKDAKQTKDAKKDAPEKSEAKANPEPARITPLSKKISLIAHRIEEPAKGKTQDAKSLRKTAALDRHAKGTSDVSADPKAIPAPPKPEHDDARKNAEAGFLHRLHKGACGVFGTVLGPEANEMHRDHFHFDLASRRRSALCQ